MHKITLEINPAGEPTIKVTGVAGKSCKALTAELEGLLGKTTSDTPTEEMSHATSVQAGH